MIFAYERMYVCILLGVCLFSVALSHGKLSTYAYGGVLPKPQNAAQTHDLEHRAGTSILRLASSLA